MNRLTLLMFNRGKARIEERRMVPRDHMGDEMTKLINRITAERDELRHECRQLRRENAAYKRFHELKMKGDLPCSPQS